MKEHEHEHEYEYSQGLAKRSSGPDMLNLQRLSDQKIYIIIIIIIIIIIKKSKSKTREHVCFDKN